MYHFTFFTSSFYNILSLGFKHKKFKEYTLFWKNDIYPYLFPVEKHLFIMF